MEWVWAVTSSCQDASFLKRPRNSRCTVITDLDTSKRNTQKDLSCCDAMLETEKRTAGSAWETWTVAAANGVDFASVRWEINFWLTFETATFFCVYSVFTVSLKIGDVLIFWLLDLLNTSHYFSPINLNEIYEYWISFYIHKNFVIKDDALHCAVCKRPLGCYDTSSYCCRHGDGYSTSMWNLLVENRLLDCHTCQCPETNWFKPLNTKRRLLYLKTQFVPRSKHFSSRL